LPKVTDIFDEYNVVGTWFIQHDLGQYYTKDYGKVDEKFPDIVEKLSQIGEIGTHVHFRKKNGDFCSDYEFQMDLIENATDSLRDKGFDIQSFRGGDHFFNNDTVKILEDLNYKIDSSVMQGFSRRKKDNFLIDHRIRTIEVTINEPYFLSNINYLISGKSKVLEIPVTNLLFFLHKPSFFIPFPTPGNIKIGKISNLSFLLTKMWGFLKEDVPLVFLFHDFTFSGKKSLDYFRKFIEKCSDDNNIKFVTLKEIKEEYITKR
jgi:hypothetical protein